MKKLLIALALVSVIVLALATTVTADNGPHGGFTATTEKCAGCHRIHRAQSDDGFLLVAGNVYLLCVSCHNGSGAYTNVVNGAYVAGGAGTVPGLAAPLGTQGDGGAPLFGGGFVNTLSAHTWLGKDGYDTAAAPVSNAVTSTHSVKGSPVANTGAGTLWGSNDVNIAPDVWTAPAIATATDHTLECTSCHDPHGRAGRSQAAGTGTAWTANVTGAVPTTYGGVATGDPIPSYRLLRFEPHGANGFDVTGDSLKWWNLGNSQTTDGITVRETASYWYTINSDEALDGTLQMYRNRYDTTAGAWTGWSSYIAQYGDPVGRSWTYVRPAIDVYSSTTIAGGYAVTNTAGTQVTMLYSCRSTGDMTAGGTLPAEPVGALTVATFNLAPATYYTACLNPLPGTAFNNSNTTQTGFGAANRTAGRSQVSFWCGTCHDKYVAASNNSIAGAAGNSRTSDSGDLDYKFRHNSATSVPCVDCHFAHGSSADMALTNSTYPATSANGAASLAAPAGGTGSYLLKLDNRSTCLKCHGHDVNFQYIAIP